jgi:hypothetical protein
MNIVSYYTLNIFPITLLLLLLLLLLPALFIFVSSF